MSHAAQGSVIKNNAATAVATVCLLTDWSEYSL